MALICQFAGLSLTGQMGVVLGALSIVTLVRTTIYAGFGPTFTVLIDYYEQMATTLFGWLEPIILAGLGVFASLLDIEITLYPHWKHIFILMFVYFSRDASLAYASGFRPTAGFMVIAGTVYSLTAGVFSGLIELQPGAFSANYLFAAAPILGISAYNVTCQFWFSRVDSQRSWLMRPMSGDTWIKRFLGTLPGSTYQALGGLLILFVGLQLPLIRNSPSAGLIMLMILIILLGLNCIWFAVKSTDGVDSEKRLQTFLDRPGAKVGFAMLNTFILSIFFVLTNAGLGAFGL